MIHIFVGLFDWYKGQKKSIYFKDYSFVTFKYLLSLCQFSPPLLNKSINFFQSIHFPSVLEISPQTSAENGKTEV